MFPNLCVKKLGNGLTKQNILENQMLTSLKNGNLFSHLKTLWRLSFSKIKTFYMRSILYQNMWTSCNNEFLWEFWQIFLSYSLFACLHKAVFGNHLKSANTQISCNIGKYAKIPCNNYNLIFFNKTKPLIHILSNTKIFFCLGW